MSSGVLAALSVPAVVLLSAVGGQVVAWWERRRPSAPVVFRERLAIRRGQPPGRGAAVRGSRGVR